MNSRKRILLAGFTIVGLALFLHVLPQSEGARLVTLSRNEGLSMNSVMCLLQDHSGFVWIGTENGLNRFDGNDFTVFRPIPGDPASLSHGYILTLHEDRAGILWIGTFNGGLNRYDPTRGEFLCYRHAPDRADSLSSDIVGAILEGRDGAFWIGTDNGLNRLDRKSGRFTRYPLATDRPGRSNHIHDLCEDREGGLWIGTYGGGIYKFDPQTGNYTQFRNDPADPASLSDDNIYKVHIDREGALWVGTESGLNRFDRRSGRFTLCLGSSAEKGLTAQDAIHAICEDRNGRLWIGTAAGMICLDKKPGSGAGDPGAPFHSRTLNENSIYSIYEDSSGIIWIGTIDAGVKKFDRKQKRFSHYRSLPGEVGSLDGNMVYSFWEDDSRTLWIATEKGLDRLDRENTTCTHFRNVPGNRGGIGEGLIRCILPDRSGGLWLGTDGHGLKRFDPGSGQAITYRNDPENPKSLSYDRIRAMIEDRAGDLWIGTLGGGLNRFDRESATFTRFQFSENDPGSLSDNVTRVILEDHNGTIWVGTHGGGLNRFDRETGKFTRYRHDATDPSSLNNDFVFCLHEDREGNLWIGTWGGGLNRMDRDKGTFSHYTTADGLASNEIEGILEDESGNLWLATNEGLSRFTPRTRQFRNYDVSDGLQGKEFNSGAAYQNRNGEMFFGGMNGFNSFFPQDIFDNWYVPPVRITSFKILNKEVRLPRPIWETTEIELSPKDYLFSFEFAALDYTAPERNRYAYKLEGLTDEWIYTDSRRRLASFSLLPPGKYIFRVKGSNSDGIWNEKDVSLVIRVRGPWWRSWWFVALLLVITVLSVYQWSRTRIRRMGTRVRTTVARDQFFAKVNISPREKEIIELLLKGRTNKEIAAQLFIEISTVKIHVHHVFRKLGVRSRAQLLRLFHNLQVE